MRVVSVGTISTSLGDAPDYSRTVSSSVQRAGFRLRENQSLKVFALALTNIPSPFCWVTTPLPPGQTIHFIDCETGLSMPYTVPQGYTITQLALASKMTQDRNVRMYIDGMFLGYNMLMTGGEMLYLNEVFPEGTSFFDPTGATSHTWDLELINMGTSPLEGGGAHSFILEKVGSEPLPDVKTVKCKFCGNTQTVPVEVSQVICSNCGKLNLYYTLKGYKGVC
jgi:hypothetical protein